MRKLLALLAVSALLASAAAFGATLAAGADSPRTEASATTVRVDDNFFSSSRKTVRRGGKITFRFVGNRRHNVSKLNGDRLISTRTSGSRSVTFNRSRTVICSLHPGAMRLRVTVKR